MPWCRFPKLRCPRPCSHPVPVCLGRSSSCHCPPHRFSVTGASLHNPSATDRAERRRSRGPSCPSVVLVLAGRACKPAWVMTQHPEADSGRFSGLSTAEAKARLASEGPNELPAGDHRTGLGILRDVVREPMLALLLAGGVIYALLGTCAMRWSC
ncbi:cation-transporting P-type ATPase [Gemmobacter lanyuensis]